MWRHMDLVKAASGELSPMFTCSEVNMYFSLLCKAYYTVKYRSIKLKLQQQQNILSG